MIVRYENKSTWAPLFNSFPQKDVINFHFRKSFWLIMLCFCDIKYIIILKFHYKLIHHFHNIKMTIKTSPKPNSKKSESPISQFHKINHLIFWKISSFQLLLFFIHIKHRKFKSQSTFIRLYCLWIKQRDNNWIEKILQASQRAENREN